MFVTQGRKDGHCPQNTEILTLLQMYGAFFGPDSHNPRQKKNGVEGEGSSTATILMMKTIKTQ
jgi:hypothetical protein